MATEIIIGDSQDVEAEYGSRDNRGFTVLLANDGEVYSCEGFDTLAAAKVAYQGDADATYLYI